MPGPKTKRKALVQSTMLERRSIRLDEELAHEIDDLARRTDRTVPATVRLLLRLGLQAVGDRRD